MIVAFSGKAQSGKTTAAKAIQATNPGGLVVISFATPLKRMAMEQFGLTPDDIQNKTRVLAHLGLDITVRQLLITLGQMCRAIDPDFWVKKLMKDADKAISQGKGVLIDDLRFRNEASLLTERGSILVRVVRPGVELIDDISETDLDNWKFEHVIHNTSGLASYKKLVVDFREDLEIGSPAKA